MSKTAHIKRAKATKEILIRAIRSYDGACRRYHYDCNTRLDALPGDSKRNKLFWRKDLAFRYLVSLIDP